MKAIELCSPAMVFGYQQPAAFAAPFRSTFGATPKVWIAALTKLE